MPRISSDDKNARLERIYRHVKKFPDGIKSSEIARDLGLDRRIVDDYLKELQSQWKVDKPDGPRWFPVNVRPMTLRPLELEPEEAMVLYLAARLFVKQTDKKNVIAENVLVYLADMLEADASVSGDILAAANELAQNPVETGHEDIFRTVMRGYLYRRKIEIHYHPYKGRSFQTTISPYLIEPSSIGFSTYVIGHSSNPDDLRTYKIGRIQSARIIHDMDYTVPDDFSGLEILGNAWSIYYGEETENVILRFHPDVVRRVQESNWHPSQELESDPEQEGYLRMKLQVASTIDLLPWIRGWGDSVEVLAPTHLREEISGQARRMAALYGWQPGRGVNYGDDDELDLSGTLNDFFGE